MSETKRTILERVDANLKALLAIFSPKSLRLVFSTPQNKTNLEKGQVQMATTLTDIQHVTVTLEADDKAGNPVPVVFTTPPTWATSDATILTVTPSADGQSADVVAVGALGNAQVTVTGTTDGGLVLNGVGDLTVVASGASTFKLTFGVPADKA